MVDRVETAIRSEGWSWTICERIASETGWSVRTVYRVRGEVLDTLADEEAEDRPRRRAQLLADMRRTRERAVEAKAFGPVARLIDMETRVLGVDQPLLVPEDEPGELDTSTTGMLAEVRGMRKAAQRSGSHVAAAKLLDLEAGLVADLALERRAANERARSAADPEALEDRIVAALLGMPDKLRRQILARVAE